MAHTIDAHDYIVAALAFDFVGITGFRENMGGEKTSYSISSIDMRLAYAQQIPIISIILAYKLIV